MSQDTVDQSIESGFENAEVVSRLLIDHAERIAAEHGALYGARADKWRATLARAFVGVPFDTWRAYSVDALQRGIIALDVLRRRGNTFNAHEASGMPPVLDFAYEQILDGRTLPRPVNYSLLVITPPDGVAIDPAKRPFMIVDPRAGHGAGIGGFKPESQVGDAFEKGHAVYF